MISEFHLRGWQRIPEVEIVALGNRTLERAEERRMQFFPAARTYDDLTKLLDKEQLDFIDILTPPAVHLEHCLAARENEVHIICQKPLCDTLVDARALVAAMEAYPKLFAVHENHRYRPWFRQLQGLLSEGFFGTPYLVRFEQHDAREPAEIYKLQTEQGILLEYGTHLVDMMRSLMGEPSSVYADMCRLNPRVKGESFAHVVYQYPHTSVLINIAWKPAGLAHGRVTLEGDAGEAYYEGTMARGDSSRYRLVKGDALVIDEARSPYDDYVESFYLFERECTEAMLNNKEATQTGGENLKTLECTFAAYYAANEKRIVDMTDYSYSAGRRL